MEQTYQLVHFNVNSIATDERKKQLIHYMNIYQPEIVFLSETKLKPNNRFSVKNYNVFRSDRTETNGGGTAILTRNTVEAVQMESHSNFFESCAIKIKTRYQSYVCIAIYVPPTSKVRFENYKVFLENLSQGLSVISAGDFNGWHSHFGDRYCDTRGNALFQLHHETEFKVISAEAPTCYRSPSGSYIDHFILSNDLMNACNGKLVNLVKFSDHTGIGINSEINFCELKKRPKSLRKQYEKTNISEMNKFMEKRLELLCLPTSANLSVDGLETVTTGVQEIFKEATNKFVPSSEIAYSFKLSRTTESILKEKHRLSRLLSRKRKAMAEQRVINKLNSSINIINVMLRNNLRHDNSVLYHKKLDEVRCNADAFKFIKAHSCHNKKLTQINKLFLDESKTAYVSEPKDIVNNLATLFEANHRLTTDKKSVHEPEVKESIEKLSNHNSNIVFDDGITAKIENNEQLCEINTKLGAEQKNLLTSTEEIIEIINTRRNKASCGFDEMPNKLIKHFSLPIIVFLTVLFNQLTAVAHFPRVWKFALITPIPKNGRDKSTLANWRPISLLNCVAKIYEVIVERKIRSHFENNKLFSSDQFGFRKGRSTVHALTKFNNQVLEGLNKGKITTTVLLDIQAAFDTVWQEALVHKMMKFNVNYQLCKLVHNFLQNRHFAVKYGEVTSETKTIQAGTPQGSCLSALLFIIFISDMPNHPIIKKSQFADDTMLYLTHKAPAGAEPSATFHLFQQLANSNK